MRKRLPAAPVLIAALFAAGPAPALTFLELTTGDDALLPDARSVALGRTRVGASTGAFTAASNPALLPRTEGILVTLGGGTLKLKESRSTPAFDSFDGFLVESIYVLNDEYQLEGGFGATWGRRVGAVQAGAGVAWAPVRDWQYDYAEEVRDNNVFTQPRDRLIAVNEIESDGSVRALSVGVGADVLERVSAGATLQVLTGEQDLKLGTRFVRDDTEDFSTQDVGDLSGVRFVLGGAARPHHSIEIGATWKNATKIDGDFTRTGDAARFSVGAQAARTGEASGEVEVRLPHEVAVGAAFRPRAKLRTEVRLDAMWTQWSEYRHGLWADPGFHDVWEARLGIEHVFYNGMPVRFGFRYAPSPLDDEIATTAFGFGGGLDLGPVRADLAFEVANRDYRFEDVFDDALFGGTSRAAKDLVEESSTSAFVTLSWRADPRGG